MLGELQSLVCEIPYKRSPKLIWQWSMGKNSFQAAWVRWVNWIGWSDSATCYFKLSCPDRQLSMSSVTGVSHPVFSTYRTSCNIMESSETFFHSLRNMLWECVCLMKWGFNIHVFEDDITRVPSLFIFATQLSTASLSGSFDTNNQTVHSAMPVLIGL